MIVHIGPQFRLCQLSQSPLSRIASSFAEIRDACSPSPSREGNEAWNESAFRLVFRLSRLVSRLSLHGFFITTRRCQLVRSLLVITCDRLGLFSVAFTRWVIRDLLKLVRYPRYCFMIC